MAKQIDVEQVQSGIESEGFEYYMNNYAESDLKDTKIWPLVQTYIAAQRALEDALREAGVELDG